jgi:hypothetical protein
MLSSPRRRCNSMSLSSVDIVAKLIKDAQNWFDVMKCHSSQSHLELSCF